MALSDIAIEGKDEAAVRRFIKDLFLNAPSDLTPSQKTTLLGLLGANPEIGDNAFLPSKVRAGNDAQRQEWRTRLAAAATGDVPEQWSDIAVNTQISLGKVVVHGGAYFGCVTQHNKGATGPDGDPTNWILLSNWRGDWAAAWYPAGSIVRRAGYPWVATAVVSRNDPAPDATTNTKWLRLGSASADVVVASSDTSIPSSANGDTYVNQGSSNITYTLPAASGGNSVGNGWELVISNQGAGDLTVDGNGADTIDGNATLVISDIGRSVKLQKIANGSWITIADTKDEVGSGGGGGGQATIGDNSITPDKAQAGTDAQKKAWRERLSSSHISQVSAALPAVTNFNTGDLIIVARGGNTSTNFIDVDDPSTQLTTTVAGDLIMLLNSRWTRLGNLFSGGIAAAAARSIAVSNRDRLMVSLTQGDFYGGSREAIQGTYHINVESMPGAFPTANVVQVWIGDPGIQRVLSQSWDPAEIQRSLEFEIGAAAADNLATNGLVDVGDELGVEIRLIAPGAVELYRHGFSFPIIEKPPDPTGLNQAQVDARVTALRRDFREITAVAGASKTWTFQLQEEDKEIMVVQVAGGNSASNRGFHTRVFPRALFTAANQNFVVDSRVTNSNNFPDNASAGFSGSISSAHVLTIVTTGWGQGLHGAPRVFAK